MNTEIKIEHQSDVPETLIKRFVEKAELKNVEIVNQSNVEHFDFGGSVYDIALWFSNQSSNIAVNLVSTAISGVLGSAITFLIVALRKNKESKPQSGIIPFALIIEGREYALSLTIEELLSDEQATNAVKTLEALLKNQTYKLYLTQPDYFKQDTTRTEIELIYNPESNLWLPVNQKEIKAFFIKADEDARNLMH